MNEFYTNFSDMDSKPLTGCIRQGIFALVPKKIIFLVSVLSTYNTLWKVLFLFLKRQGENKCAFSHTVTSTVSPEKVSSTTYIVLKVESSNFNVWWKNKLRKRVIIRMMRLPWNIQMFRRVIKITTINTIYNNKATAQQQY